MGRNVVFNGSTMLRKWASSSPHTHHTLHLTHSIPIFSALGSTHHTHPHIWLLSIYVQCVHCAMCIGYHLILHQVQSLQTWNAHFFVCFLPQLVVFFLFNTTYQHCFAISPLASQAVEGVEQVTFYQGRVGGARLSIAHTSKSHPPLISSITTTTISSAIFCMVGGRNFQSQSLHCTMCTLYSHVPQCLKYPLCETLGYIL